MTGIVCLGRQPQNPAYRFAFIFSLKKRIVYLWRPNPNKMAKKEPTQSKKVQNLLDQLKSSDEEEKLGAIQELKIHGNESVVEPLVREMNISTSTKVKNTIADVLNTAKSTKVPQALIDCLNNPEFADSRQLMLASIWNSGLDYKPYMGDIARATVEGDFMYAMECITIIENIEGFLNEDEIMDALLVFQGYLAEDKGDDQTKRELILEIVLTLQNMNDNV